MAVSYTHLIYGARNLHFGTVKELFSPDQVEFVIALGEPRDRKLRFEEIRAAGYGFGKVIAPTARVSQSATLGEGFVALDGALVEPLSVVGDLSLIHIYHSVCRADCSCTIARARNIWRSCDYLGGSEYLECPGTKRPGKRIDSRQRC